MTSHPDTPLFKTVNHQGETLAIIVSHRFSKDGLTFFTPPSFSQQLAFMAHPEGHTVKAHTHKPARRFIDWTQEVLLIKSGKIRLDIYDQERNYLESHVLGAGDFVLLARGGHGITVLEKSEIIEVKQGPYLGDADKDRFEKASEEKLKLGESL